MSDFENIRQAVVDVVPHLKHCQLLGVEVVEAIPAQLILSIPYSEKIVGNPETGVVHGGVLTTLMDTACGFAAILSLDAFGICPTLDLRIDYMKPAVPGKALLGRAEAYKVTKTVIFARGIAYHEGEEDEPIAHCTASFMRITPEAVKGSKPL